MLGRNRCLEDDHPLFSIAHLGKGRLAGLVNHALGPTEHGQIVTRVSKALCLEQVLRTPAHTARPVLLALGSGQEVVDGDARVFFKVLEVVSQLDVILSLVGEDHLDLGGVALVLDNSLHYNKRRDSSCGSSHAPTQLVASSNAALPTQLRRQCQLRASEM